ncbi:hypothetical protein [Halocella sp. SP3-1]|uniref:hypothetical protein n=1 Tax=Halocella sp. SP3-1 TaxID=2382161 RepID=UPI000F75982A|nr:hypothetical protein [Halocella sp. SP3-1]AZO95256.1 hypothetical protein D7D81_12015 [Halocella sp. SP3-1]
MEQMALFADCLSESEKETINKAMYYAVRENYNQAIDISKTELIREALEIFKSKKEKPITSYMCNISLDDFFTSCVMRGWKNELYKIPWLKVGE